MSRITYKLSDLTTADQIEWLNALTSKISNCGNDIIAIDVDIHGYSNLHPFLRLLTDIHTEYGENKNRLVTTTNSSCPYLPIERSSLIDPRNKQIQFKNLITAVDEYRKMQIGKYLNRREIECLYRIESLLNKINKD